MVIAGLRSARSRAKRHWRRFISIGRVLRPICRCGRRRSRRRARRLSVASYLETGAVLAGRTSGDKLTAIARLDAYLAKIGVTLEGVDEAQARLALKARIEHGRGMGHGGVLNYGDCFAFALAKALGAPLLFIGDDFGTTDITSAL
ncbi:MAG: PIN domain-containing protein [Caulobacterales bacterium]